MSEPCTTCQEAAECGRAPIEHEPCRHASMHALVGCTVTGVFVGGGEESLYFVTDRGVFYYSTYGDCCSVTWFADITGFDALHAGPVISVRDLETQHPTDGRTRQEEDQAYGVELLTHGGRCTIAYRNSSNGYYGGSLNAVERLEALPPGVREIRDDWSA